MNNLAELLRQHLDLPDKVLYRQWVDGAWRDFTQRDIAAQVARWQQAFREHGFEKGDRIALCLKNGTSWVAIDMAALGMGLVIVPLYINDNAENIAWCVTHSDARLLVLENSRMLETLRNSIAGATLPPIICFEGANGSNTGDDVALAEDWLPKNSAGFEVVEMAPDDLATVVYTSGTTGRPKGAKLSHRNILANIEAINQRVRLRATDSLLSVLPLSHMFERTCGYYTPLSLGLTVSYCRGIQQLAEDLATLKPTVLIAVPRVFERFLARIEQALAGSRVKRAMFHQTVRLGWKCFQGEANALEQAAYKVLKRIVATPVMNKLGGHLRMTVVGGAKVETRIVQTFVALGLSMVQGYGLTEASPVVAGTPEGDADPTSVGTLLDGLEISISPNYELLVRGPSVMLGYWRNPEATAAVLDVNGWLNTGDQVDIHDGRIYIKGRTKDILVLSNGEKVPPEAVETAILNDPVFEQVVLVGEGRAYLTLIAVTQESDEKKLIKRATAMLKDFPRYIRVRRVIIESKPWTIEEALLTPTMKIKRAPLLEKYRERIEHIYSGGGLAD